MDRFNHGLKLLLLVVWIWVIFSFSSHDATVSSELSGSVLNTVVGLIEIFEPDFSNRFDLSGFHRFLRSGAHFYLYFFLGVFSFNAFHIFFKDWFRLSVDAILFSLVVGIFDEIYQSFIPGRAMMLEDILIDGLGAFFGVLLIALIQFKFKKPKIYS